MRNRYFVRVMTTLLKRSIESANFFCRVWRPHFQFSCRSGPQLDLVIPYRRSIDKSFRSCYKIFSQLAQKWWVKCYGQIQNMDMRAIFCRILILLNETNILFLPVNYMLSVIYNYSLIHIRLSHGKNLLRLARFQNFSGVLNHSTL